MLWQAYSAIRPAVRLADQLQTRLSACFIIPAVVQQRQSHGNADVPQVPVGGHAPAAFILGHNVHSIFPQPHVDPHPAVAPTRVEQGSWEVPEQPSLPVPKEQAQPKNNHGLQPVFATHFIQAAALGKCLLLSAAIAHRCLPLGV